MDESSPTNRRELLRDLLGRAVGHALRKLPERLLKNELYGREPTLLRPPGAGDLATLSATCRRCGQCADACRSGAILMDDLPAIIAVRQGCSLCAEQSCSATCPSGALRPTPPESIRMGVAIWSKLRCRLSAGEPCDVCVLACPRQAISQADGRIVVDGDRCAGCGLCEYGCPQRPRAIYIDPL